MSWVEAQLNDEALFPLQLGTPFPKHFLSLVKMIFRRLFRCYGHIYHSHFQKIVGLGAEVSSSSAAASREGQAACAMPPC